MTYTDYLADCALSRSDKQRLTARHFGVFVDRPARYFDEVLNGSDKFSESLYWNDVYLSSASTDLFYPVDAPMPGPRTKAFDSWYQLDKAGRRPLCTADLHRQLPGMVTTPVQTKRVGKVYNAVSCSAYVDENAATVRFVTSDISAWLPNARRVGALHGAALAGFILDLPTIDISVLELETGYVDTYQLNVDEYASVPALIRSFYEAGVSGWTNTQHRGEITH